MVAQGSGEGFQGTETFAEWDEGLPVSRLHPELLLWLWTEGPQGHVAFAVRGGQEKLSRGDGSGQQRPPQQGPWTGDPPSPPAGASCSHCLLWSPSCRMGTPWGSLPFPEI